jgi:hypothetical protein
MSAQEQFDPALLETLTPEEREAMQEEMTEDEKAALAAVAGDDDDDGDDDAADENAQPVEAAASVSDEPADEGGEPAKPAQQTYRAELPEDFQAQVDDLKTKREELAEKFKAGDIEFDEFRAEDTVLANEERKLDRAITKAEIANEMNAQKFETEWRSNVLDFTNDVAKSGGIDYRKDLAGQKKLDGFVNQIFSDPDNATLTMREVLDKAHAMVKLVYKPAAAATAAASDTKPAKPVSRKPDLSKLPATLAHVPGGDGPGDIGGGEFAALDGLDGFELEQAIARMSPAQRDKFASLAN